ncbi:unnamed protein product [Rangifer tarandus platyrhynchus]|uniref:Uncharacterized protein n=2 Tax=Rangifer tarandus platyrhynchus TaxID=3082113 RepID=A0AC59ZQ56_RANTA|nr:unnamed protein product [Rangifer tarandus platyrhynchus]
MAGERLNLQKTGNGKQTVVVKRLSDWFKGQTRSVAKSCPTLCAPVDHNTRGFPVLRYLPVCSNSCLSVMLPNHLILCHPLLLLPSIFPSIRVFSSESEGLIGRTDA